VVSASSGAETPTGTIDVVDTTTGNDLGKIALIAGKATVNTAALGVGAHTLVLSYGGDGSFVPSRTTMTVSVVTSVLVLDPKSSASVSVSGSSGIHIPGTLFVDSSSKSAVSISGNAQVAAGAIDVVGAVQKSGNASFSPAPVTGVSLIADPL